MSDKFRDDALTLASFGVVAFAVADQTHEALGHGLATLITGGKLIALTTCYLNSVGGSERWIPASGGLANLAVGMIALALLPILPKPSPQMRYFLVLVVAFNLFFAAGYPVYSGIALFGDWAAVISGLAPAWLWRTLLAIIGVASVCSIPDDCRAIRPKECRCIHTSEATTGEPVKRHGPCCSGQFVDRAGSAFELRAKIVGSQDTSLLVRKFVCVSGRVFLRSISDGSPDWSL